MSEISSMTTSRPPTGSHILCTIFLCKFRAQGAGAQPRGRGAIGHGHPMRLGKYNKLFTKYPNRAKFHSEVNQSRFKNIVFNFTDLGG